MDELDKLVESRDCKGKAQKAKVVDTYSILDGLYTD